jgi:hypothetical protein
LPNRPSRRRDSAASAPAATPFRPLARRSRALASRRARVAQRESHFSRRKTRFFFARKFRARSRRVDARRPRRRDAAGGGGRKIFLQNG